MKFPFNKKEKQWLKELEEERIKLREALFKALGDPSMSDKWCEEDEDKVVVKSNN
jgi:hypothetical protein